MKDAKELKLMTTDDAVAQIQDNMILGIGTGSTIELLIPKIAERIQQDNLNVTGVCTSNKSEFLAKQYNINVVDINDITYIDLAIDGADEIDSDLNLIKGGGGALFREKVIDEMARQFIVLADEINDEYICPNNKRLGFKRYAYRHDKYGFKRDFKLYECDDCSECPLKHQCMKYNSKTNKKIMKNYNWEYFKAQINKKLSEPKIKTIYSQRKIDVEPVFGFMKAILGFTRMSVRGINKAKRELGFVLMALNIRKVTAQRAENNQKNYKKDNFYIISIEIVFFHLSRNFMSRTLFYFLLITLIPS